MADLAEILMVEHLAIKESKWLIDRPYSNDAFTNFHSYVKECHIEVEEKICFPILESYSFPDAKQFRERVERIKADHKLIDTLAVNIMKWHDSGNEKLVGERMPLFYKLLVEHNASEEIDLFPRWNKMDNREIGSSVRDALSIIESFGIKRYIDATCLDESVFRYFFRTEKK